MPKIPVVWGEWRPDIALRDNEFAADVENVFAGSSSYMPAPDLAPFDDAIVPPPPLTDKIVGLASARTTTGEWRIYAGTASKLYSWRPLDGWTDVSRAVGGDYAVGFEQMWSFTQFGKWLIAVNPDDVPQVVDVDAGGTFDALGGSPPAARNVRTIGDFVILGGLTANPRMIQWSAINDVTGWTVGLNLSDEQELPDGGPVQGLSGDKIGYIVQDRAIRLLQFLPGDTTYIFSISKVVYDRGSISKFGYTSIGDTLYFLADDGFYALSGANLIPIGHEKVNDWWVLNSDQGRWNTVQCFNTVKPYVAWPYCKSVGSQMYDGVILFNWANQRWTKLSILAQMWATMATTDLDLDTDGTEPGDPILDSNAHGLDSFLYIGGRPRAAAIDQNGNLASLTGPNLQATLESAEYHPVPGMRAMVGDVYPLADAAEGVIYVGTRERLQDPVVFGPACPIEITGSAAVYTSARLCRFRTIIPRASIWTHAQGVLADAQQDGSVA